MADTPTAAAATIRPQGYELPVAVRELLAAVAARDSARAAGCFTDRSVYWTCVPREPYRGRAAIEKMFDRLNGLATRIQWEASSFTVQANRVWLEHADHFWIDERECVMECVGILTLDETTGLISEMRDYCDMETWSAQLSSRLA
jgi:limonene-1,2-epoxide hydrolase